MNIFFSDPLLTSKIKYIKKTAKKENKAVLEPLIKIEKNKKGEIEYLTRKEILEVNSKKRHAAT